MDHGEEVSCEVVVWVCDSVTVCLIEKDEACASSPDNPLDELDFELGEPVTMGHHNLCDHSLLDLLQKPRQPFSLLVEPRRDVLEDGVTWVRLLHTFDLALQIIFLLGR